MTTASAVSAVDATRIPQIFRLAMPSSSPGCGGSSRRVRASEKPRDGSPWALGCVKPGDDLLSRLTHYHGPRVLNGRVRDGNGCGHTGMVAGKLLPFTFSVRRRRPAAHAAGLPLRTLNVNGVSTGSGKS